MKPVLCCRDNYLKFFQFGFHFASQKVRMSFQEVDLTELLPYVCEIGEQVCGTDDDGFAREVTFSKETHKATIDETVAGVTSWPPGTELCLSGLEERPGSFTVTLTAPVGGRSTKTLGRCFQEYLVSW